MSILPVGKTCSKRQGNKTRMKAFKELKHRLESELDHDNGMPQLRAFGSIPLKGIAR